MTLMLKFSGAAMAAGALLFFGRMAPIFAILPDDMAFPPETATDLVRLAQLAGPRWPLSHAMGLAAVSLFTFGYWGHAQALARSGHRLVGTVAAVIATIAFSAFAAALVIDGFFLPEVAMAHASDSANAPSIAAVDKMHQRALTFFTPAVFLMFIAIGVFSSRMLHGFIHSRWLGGLGMMIAIAGPTAYLFGVAGPNWDNLQIGGSLMMLGYLWHFLVGATALFGKDLRP
ncbi:MAG: hypothetical protein AAFX54_10145 [Pseudomonadota bacterium]